MPDTSYAWAALAGLLSFLSPCILPMVPFYLAYLAGISMAELRGNGAIPSHTSRRMFLNAIAFALGVTTIFVILGLGATILGQYIAPLRRPLSLLASAILLLFGLHFLGVFRIALINRQAKFETRNTSSNAARSYLVGLAFGFGWTPCVGPVLTAVLMIASTSDDPMRGAGLLLVYGLAMTLPFVAASLLVRPFLRAIKRGRRVVIYAEKATGAMLIIFAALIATDSITVIADWLIRNFDWSATLI